MENATTKPVRPRRPSGFRGKSTDKFLMKETVYGVKYFCATCGWTALGTSFKDDAHHHKKDCPHRILYEAQHVAGKIGAK